MLQASALVVLGMFVLALGVASLVSLAFFRLSSRARWKWPLLGWLWLAIPAALALRGVFTEWHSRPPPMMAVLILILVGVVALAFSPAGRRVALETPLFALVGFQAFRLPLELIMHRAAEEGVMPPQMSYAGWNFDIVTGATALALGLGLLRWRVPRGLVLAWNLLGTALLVTIMAIAASSTPTFAAFGPERLNTWIALFPAVWLPLVLVPSALLGHLLLWRRLYLGSST